MLLKKLAIGKDFAQKSIFEHFMKLSVITINYNNRDGLRKTVESVVNQTCRDFEYIIIDGGSTDGSVDVIKQYADRIDYWVSEPDKGIYNAMNKGIAVAHGEYLNFMNSGDCLHCMDTIADVLPLLVGKDFYVGDIVNESNGRRDVVKFPRDLSPKTIVDQIVFRLIPHQASFIRKSLFKKFGNYREDLRIASDWYFFYRTLVMNGASIEPLCKTIAIFDTTGISCTDSKRIDERISSQDSMPCQKLFYCFYRDNAEIVSALKSTKIGYFLMRVYFFFYRHLSKKPK